MQESEINLSLRSDISRYIAKEKEIENLNQLLKDEHQALQLAFASLEDKLRKVQVSKFHIFLLKITFFTI